MTLGERVVIDVGVRMGRSIRKIAEELGRAPSTVMREIERNAFCYGRYRQRYRFGAPKKGGRDAKPRYRAAGAQARAQQRARRPKPGKLAVNARLHDEVQTRLLEKYSPQQIARRLQLDFPDDAEMRVSPETIYQSIYVQGGAVCVVSCINACAPGGRYANHSAAPINAEAGFRTWSTSANAHQKSRTAPFLDIGRVI
ncbi:hypothetical protein MAGR_29850 [Mycolicibacterium agri]|uniref:Transposase IS30-like HTH domain-containing protein n=1 Tax=Mycolicibacterium agri TaxID=36811 RepID=A0A7I9W1F6_MYCAG|nr:hypothetical protein MAGR_29850 [Mycolicibacterium agri]